MNNTVLVTGAAGFIGMHTALTLAKNGNRVIAIDSVNNYYSTNLKRARITELAKEPLVTFLEADLVNETTLNQLLHHNISHIIHLAAQPGVRYSLENPDAYITSNILGFQKVIDFAKKTNCKHFIYASSSSVYGNSASQPFCEKNGVDHPISLYAATKRSNELVAHTYSHLYRLPTTGLRFFTVYGPWGRPDMAVYGFTEKIDRGEPIVMYAKGELLRDFTYVDDIVNGIVSLIDNPPKASENLSTPNISNCPFGIYNIGNCNPEPVAQLVKYIEHGLGKKAKIIEAPLQPGDVWATYASTEELNRLTGFHSSTSLEEGIKKFVSWYKEIGKGLT